MAKETLTIMKGGEPLPSGIVIHDISEAAPVTSITGVDRGSGIGQRITAYKRQYMDVTLKIAFLGRLNQTQRAEAINDVIRWAQTDGALTVGHRPGCELHARLLTLPVRQNQQKWEQDYTFVFRAHELPFWVSDADEVIVRSNGAPSGTLKASIDGTASTPLCASIKGALSRITLTGAYQTMTFANLSMTSSSVFELGCDERGLMFARINGTSCMGKLLTTSNDAIMLPPGINDIGVSLTGTTSACRLYTRARWA